MAIEAGLPAVLLCTVRSACLWFISQGHMICMLGKPSIHVVGLRLTPLGLRCPSSQAFTSFGRTKFIAWCLWCSSWGMPTGSRIFVITVHLRIILCLALTTLKWPCAIFQHGWVLNRYYWSRFTYWQVLSYNTTKRMYKNASA